MLTDEFRKAKSASIIYDGKTVLLYDQLEVPETGNILLTFLGTDSEWRQGVWIGDMPKIRDLKLTVLGQTAPSMVFWQDTSPREVETAFKAPQRSLSLYNVWENAVGRRSSQLMGAGMHLEVEDGKRIYRCNDGHPEVTFSHLVFTMQIEES